MSVEGRTNKAPALFFLSCRCKNSGFYQYLHPDPRPLRPLPQSGKQEYSPTGGKTPADDINPAMFHSLYIYIHKVGSIN